ncbi:hypothetical protein PPROV_000519200 [Pycnococcus provasolii]|uniref:Cleft lip and palate transmembrane protein 1 n=1 Tax=Pycnococcus provasolii TaxID=41880 RepID=A0A830HN23_9CHLO|nr:hypothetical protein PPROV_000519200 [Pycnococcus provasolii]
MAAAVEEEAAAPVAVAPNGNANNAAEAENGDQPDVLRGLFGAVMQGVKYYMFFQLAMMLMGGSANNFRQIANSSAATGTGSLANQATSPSEAATHGQTAEAGGGGGGGAPGGVERRGYEAHIPTSMTIRPAFRREESLDVYVFVCNSELIPRRSDINERCNAVGETTTNWLPTSVQQLGLTLTPPASERDKPESIGFNSNFDLPVTLWPHLQRQEERPPPPPPSSPLSSDFVSVAVGKQYNMYVHALFCRHQAPCFTDDENFDVTQRFTAMARLLHTRRERTRRATRRLFGANDEKANATDEQAEEEEESDGNVGYKEEGGVKGDAKPTHRYRLRTYYQPNVTFSIVYDETNFRSGADIAPQVGAFMEIDPVTRLYKPVVYHNDFWTFRSHHVGPLNATHFAPMTKAVPPITVSIGTMTLFRWQMQINMDHSLKMQRQMRAGSMMFKPLGSEPPFRPVEYESEVAPNAEFELVKGEDVMWNHESESMKRIFADTNPYYLALTMTVSLLHTVFDFLAFKNDVSFWREKNKNLRGLSVRSLLISAGSSLIIFLYLLDHDGETSYLILFSNGIGCLIEFWKLSKVVSRISWKRAGDLLTQPPPAPTGEGNDGSAGDVDVPAPAPPPPPVTGLTRLIALYLPFVRLPELIFKDSYMKTETEDYDAIAMKYLSWALYPLVACYALYSLYYHTHRGVYSFVINTLVGCVYTFGFITMCPQLYINYRLKSVSHLPWKQMTYRFLNTIVDDVFSFLIPMPFMHRLAVFRDDVVFLIYLYQRWIYRVDHTRVNEYGFASAEGKAQEETGMKMLPENDATKSEASAEDATLEETQSQEEKKER